MMKFQCDCEEFFEQFDEVCPYCKTKLIWGCDRKGYYYIIDGDIEYYHRFEQ